MGRLVICYGSNRKGLSIRTDRGVALERLEVKRQIGLTRSGSSGMVGNESESSEMVGVETIRRGRWGTKWLVENGKR